VTVPYLDIVEFLELREWRDHDTLGMDESEGEGEGVDANEGWEHDVLPVLGTLLGMVL
jgi:hypothetical protein